MINRMAITIITAFPKLKTMGFLRKGCSGILSSGNSSESIRKRPNLMVPLPIATNKTNNPNKMKKRCIVMLHLTFVAIY